MWWWEGKVIVHKLLVSLISTTLGTKDTVKYCGGALLGLQSSALVAQAYFQPYPQASKDGSMSVNTIELGLLSVEWFNAMLAHTVAGVDGAVVDDGWALLITMVNCIALLPLWPLLRAAATNTLPCVNITKSHKFWLAARGHVGNVWHRVAKRPRIFVAVLVALFANILIVFVIPAVLYTVDENDPFVTNRNSSECPTGWKENRWSVCAVDAKGADVCTFEPWLTNPVDRRDGACKGRFTIKESAGTTLQELCTVCDEHYTLTAIVVDGGDDRQSHDVCGECGARHFDAGVY